MEIQNKNQKKNQKTKKSNIKQQNELRSAIAKSTKVARLPYQLELLCIALIWPYWQRVKEMANDLGQRTSFTHDSFGE